MGKFLEKINPIMSDGDTKGSNKFLDKQADLYKVLFKEKWQQVPDIGHLIKTTSNAFYKLKTTDKEFSGKFY